MVAGCAEKPAVVPLEPPASTSATYAGEIQPLFDNRCIACHGCIGSPCNVKLSSFRGVERGGFGKNPYSMHFDAVPRTGMDVHATTEGLAQGRAFTPSCRADGSATENLAGTMISQLVTAGHQNNQPGFSRRSVDVVVRCTVTSTPVPAQRTHLGAHLTANPAGGMPYGLPVPE